MSTKPATVGTWDSGLVNTIAITAGHGTSGYVTNEVPTSAEINKVFNLAGQWEQYLSDGDLTLNSITNATTIASTGLITATAGITIGANQNVTVSGTGSFKRGAKVRHISPSAGHQIDAGATKVVVNANQDVVNIQAATNAYQIPITVDQGERILLIEARVKDNGSDVITMKVWRADYNGTGDVSTQIGTTANSTGAAGLNETLTSGAVTELVSSGYTTYFAVFTATFSAGTVIDGIWVTTDVP